MASRSERREVHYSGNVQGVGFRFTACRVAERFDVVGIVENLADGRVFLAAEGEGDELERFLHAVQRELARYIDATNVRSGAATGEWKQFAIRY